MANIIFGITAANFSQSLGKGSMCTIHPPSIISSKNATIKQIMKMKMPITPIKAMYLSFSILSMIMKGISIAESARTINHS
jgi:hypothetical protein